MNRRKSISLKLDIKEHEKPRKWKVKKMLQKDFEKWNMLQSGRCHSKKSRGTKKNKLMDWKIAVTHPNVNAMSIVR